MAHVKGVEALSDNSKEAREERRYEAVAAWLELDRNQERTEREIAALRGQLASSPTGASAEINALIAEQQAEVDEIKKDKEEIDQAFEKTYKCPIKRWFKDIATEAEKARVQEMIDRTNAHESGAQDSTKEKISRLRVATLPLAAQILWDNKLLPSDLRNGPNLERAAQLVRPDLAAQLPAPQALATLAAYADELQPYYDRYALRLEASQDMEKGVVVGKAKETLKEAVSNPTRWGGAAAALAGLWMLSKAFGDDLKPDDTFKKWAYGILGIGLAAGGGAFAIMGKDVLNLVSGTRADAPFSSEEMDLVRDQVAAELGTDDAEIVDNFIRVFDAPIENYADAYLAAMSSGKDNIDKSRLLSRGLSAKEAKFADDEYLKKGADAFFLDQYTIALASGEVPVVGTDKEKQVEGAKWSRNTFAGHKVGAILVAKDMAKAGVTLSSGVEVKAMDPGMQKLTEKVPSFRDAVIPTGIDNMYLIKGHLVRYNETDTHDHIFTDVLNPGNPFVKVDSSLREDTLESTLQRITDEAEKRAKAELSSLAGVPDSRLNYNPRGYYELVPPEARAAHAGLPTYLRQANDPKVPVLLYMDPTEKKARIGIDAMPKDGLPDARPVPFANLAEVAEEFEKTVVLKNRSALDTNKTLLVDYKVESYRDSSATETEVVVQYGSGKGRLVYENDKIKSYTLDSTAELEAAWRKQSNVKLVEFLSKPQVQQALLRATENYTGYNASFVQGIIDKMISFAKAGKDWVISDAIQNEFRGNWEDQVVRDMTAFIYDPVNGMAARYVRDVFKTFPTNDAFQGVEDTFFNNELTNLAGSGIVMKKVDTLKEPDHDIEWVDLPRLINERGRGPLTVALAPLKNEKPTPSASKSWTVVNGVINFVTQDAVRKEQYEQRLDAYLKELGTNVNALATPPAKVTRDQLDTEVEKLVHKAQTEAIAYWGANDQSAVEQMMLSPLKGAPAYAQWEAPTKMVASYMSNNMKWENFGFLPNAENLAEIMEVWYALIGNAATAPKTAQEATQYAEYFMWEVWVRMGGTRDLSLDRFYSDSISSVSDTQFKSNITSLKAGLKDYTTWSGSATLALRPPVMGMEPTIEKYKDTLRDHMRDWFNQQNDIKIWSRIYRWGPDMFKWQEVYERSFTRRLEDILNRYTAGSNQNDLYQDMVDLKRFVGVEQHMVYEPLIMAGQVPESIFTGMREPWSHFAEKKIIADFWKYFYPATGPRDYNGYVGYLKKNVGDILNTHFTMPNFPGLPYI